VDRGAGITLPASALLLLLPRLVLEAFLIGERIVVAEFATFCQT
jgi:hypothetical protein